MAHLLPPGLLLTAEECARLDAVLMRAAREMQLRDGAVPHRLADICADVHQVAAKFRQSALVGGGSGTEEAAGGIPEPSSSATERLSVQQAARLTGLSDSYWRRLARRGDVEASRSGSRGRWVLDGGQVAAWTANRKADLKAS